LALAAAGGCGYSRSTTSSTAPGVSVSARTLDASISLRGSWRVTFFNCSHNMNDQSLDFVVEQDGADVTFVYRMDAGLHRLRGIVDGDTVRIDDSVYDGGMEILEQWKGTISHDAQSIEGSVTRIHTWDRERRECDFRMKRQ
jgi:hypothetical protein